MNKICDNCYHGHWEHQGLICKRYPPIAHKDRPIVDPFDTCGEHKTKGEEYGIEPTRTINSTK